MRREEAEERAGAFVVGLIILIIILRALFKAADQSK